MSAKTHLCFLLTLLISAQAWASPLPSDEKIIKEVLTEIISLKTKHSFLKNISFNEHAKIDTNSNHAQLTYEFDRLPDISNPNYRQGFKGTRTIKQYGPDGLSIRVKLFKGPWKGALLMVPQLMQRIGEFNIVIIARGPKAAIFHKAAQEIVEAKAKSWGLKSAKHPNDKSQ